MKKNPPKFKPMLAATCELTDFGEIDYPVLGTPKFDGIRCSIINGVPLSRKLKIIPNRFIQKQLALLPPYDGELIVGNNFQQSTSGIMTREGKPDFTFYVFDVIPYENDKNGVLLRRGKVIGMQKGYVDRLKDFRDHGTPRIKFLKPVLIRNEKELWKFFRWCIKFGVEGACIRKPNSPYKFNRSTFKEGWLLKIKPFKDAEAKIIGFREKLHNANEATTDALGYTKRSSHKANKVPMGTLGKFVVWSKEFGKFKIGTGRGLNDKLRLEIWNNRRKYKGKWIKFKYQEHGVKNKPRIGIFMGFRDKRDM